MGDSERLIAIQEHFEKRITVSETLNYEEIIPKYIHKVEKRLAGLEISEWPFWHYTGGGVCVYYEFLWEEFIKGTVLPRDLLVLLMIYRPFAYQMLMLRSTYKEQEELNAGILAQLDELHLKPRDFIDLLETNVPEINYLSSVAYFHYFINIDFTPHLIGIDYETLQRERPRGCLFVNATHGDIFNSKELYIYREPSERLGTEFLTVESIRKFAPIVKVKSIRTKERCWIDGPLADGEENGLVIMYSDDIYTLSTSRFSKKELYRMMDGAIMKPFSEKRLHHLAAMEFYRLLGYQLTIPSGTTPQQYTDVGHIRWDIFDKFGRSHEKIEIDYPLMVTNAISMIRDENLLPEPDIEAFDAYLRLYTGSINPFSWEEFTSYLNSYFNMK